MQEILMNSAQNHAVPRVLIDPSLTKSFSEVYQALQRQPSARSPELVTTGGVLFSAEAKVTRDGRKFISLPHSNRIYEKDWGYMTNAMGQDGQRIGQYSVPLDCWVTNV